MMAGDGSASEQIELLNVMNAEDPSNKDIMTVLKFMSLKLGNLATIEAGLKEVKSDVATIKYDIEGIEGRVKVLEDEDRNAADRYNDALKELQISALVNEYNSKEYNIILYKLPGIGKKESSRTSLNKVYGVLRDVLLIEDAESIAIRNCHRLPGKEAKRLPLIFKLQYMSDKDLIWKNLKNLSEYNDGRPEKEQIQIQMTHLPKKLKKDRDALLDDYKKAKGEGKQPKWRFNKLNGEYCFMIGKQVYRPKANYFTTIF